MVLRRAAWSGRMRSFRPPGPTESARSNDSASGVSAGPGGHGSAAETVLEDLVRKTAQLLAVPTVTGAEDPEQRLNFHRALRALPELFPSLFEATELDWVADQVQLLRWPGLVSASPLLVLLHLDVSPVGPDAEERWQHPPFAGVVDEHHVHGRGSLLAKGPTVAALEAVEQLVRAGHVPARDVWLAVVPDGESLARSGETVAQHLLDRDVAPGVVLCGGGGVLDIDRAAGRGGTTTAIVGVTEKGYADLRVDVTSRPTGPVRPGDPGAPARLARALGVLDRTEFPARVIAPTHELLRRVVAHRGGDGTEQPPRSPESGTVADEEAGPHLPSDRRTAEAVVAIGPAAAAQLRTTATITSLNASAGTHRVPTSARAEVSLRIMHGDTSGTVMEHLRTAIDDEAVQLTMVECSDPAAVTDWNDPAFRWVEEATRTAMPEVLVAPGVLADISPARLTRRLGAPTLRFVPVRLGDHDLASLTGVDERISHDALVEAYAWYRAAFESLGLLDDRPSGDGAVPRS